MEIRQVEDQIIRKSITESILRQLPDYFGIEASTLDYIHQSAQQVMFACFLEEKPVGFLTLKHHNEYCLEVYAMGVLPKYHHLGMGKKLMKETFQYAFNNGYGYVSVKTLGPSDPDEGYAKTRAFYQAMGFVALEESRSFWGMDCPCLFMVKHL